MKLAAIFSDNMVLQRDKRVNVFGTTDRASIIEVEIDDIKVSEKVEAGSFCLSLFPHKAGGPYFLTVTEKDEDGSVLDTKRIENVLYGEVWIDNGQSNIEFELQNATGGQDELKTANYPEIRYFKSIKTPVIDDEFLKNEETLSWTPVTDGQFREISGVGYFFAVKLYEELKVPIGMVDCYQGGSSITCWMENEVLESIPEGKFYLDEFREATKDQTEEEFEKLLNEYNRQVEEYLEKATKAKEADPNMTNEELEKVAGCYPWPPPVGLQSAFRPGGLIETMFKRIAPYTSKGLIYYQGEEDAIRNYNNKMSGLFTDQYAVLLKRLVKEYRRLLKDPELPMFICQLPMFIDRHSEDILDWAYLRESQDHAVEKLDNTWLVNLLDCGDYDDVHPVDKKTPGERIARLAFSKLYYRDDIGSFDMTIRYIEKEDDRYILSFDNTAGKIVLKDNHLLDIRKETETYEADHIYGLQISTDGETFSVPKAKIDGENIVIESKEVIKEIRYGFFNYGKVNVYNGDGEPLRQFKVEL